MNTNKQNATVKKKNYHKNETIVIVALVAMIAVFIPLWFFVLKPEPVPVQTKPKPAEYSLYDYATFEGTDTVVDEIALEKIESIHFIKKDSSWGFVYDYVEENYFIEGYGKQISYDPTAFTFIRGFASMGTAQRMVAQGVTDFAKYGLNADNENLVKVRVKTMDGKQVEMLLGDELADKSGYYATTPGNDRVYTINPMNYGYVSCAVYDVMDTRITNPFTESEYIPNLFEIYHGISDSANPTPFVRLEFQSDAAEHEYIKTTIVTYPVLDVPYGASSNYTSMLYDCVRKSLNGEKVMDAEKAGESFSADYLKQTYGIDPKDENCMVLKFWREFEKIGKIENEVWFSPKSNDGYYFAYNPGLKTVVKISAATVPFMEWESHQFMEPAVYLQDINAVQSLHVDSTKLDEYAVKAGHKKVDVTFVSNTPIDKNEELYVTYNGGKTIPNSKDGSGEERDGIENYRYFFLSMHGIDLVGETSKEDMEKFDINLDAVADVTITIKTRKGSEHVLRFYYYGEGGKACFTFNGRGGYDVYQSTIKLFLQSCQDVLDGVSVPMR